MKFTSRILIFLVILINLYPALAVIDMLSFEASLFDSSGDPINGNITVEIYDAETGGNLIYNSSTDFIDNVTSGKVDLILGGSRAAQELNLTYGTTYYMDLNVNGNDIDYNGIERQEFQAMIGNITQARLNLTDTLYTNALIPYANLSFDLGSQENYYRNAYIQTLTLANTLDSGNISDVYLFNTGDTATGDYNFDSNTFFIDSANNFIGIRTSTPANPLNVIGDGNFTGALYVGGVQITADSNVSGGGTSNYVVKFLGATTIGNSLIYDDGTLVGIDTTAPQGKLHIDNSTALTLPWLNVTDGSNGIVFVIDNAQRVGIRTYPSEAFHVLGAGLFTSNLTVQGITDPGNLPTNFVNTTHLLDRTLLADDIADNILNTTLILDRTLLADDLADSSINTTLVVDRTLLSDDLADNTLNTTLILDRTLLADDIADNVLNTTLILDRTLLSDDLADSSINTTLVVDRTLLSDDLADSSINTTLIVDATILESDLSFSVLLRTDNVAFVNKTEEVFQNNLTIEDSLISDYIFPQNETFVRIDNVTILQDLRVIGSSYLGSFIIKDDLNVGQTNITSTFTGIGAINPLFLLHLNISDDLNESVTPLLVLEKTNSSTGAGDNYGSSILFRLADDTGEIENISMISGILTDVSNGTERGALVFYTGYGDVNGLISNLSSAEKVRIDAQGRVGIGTSAPTHTLNIAGDANLTSDLNVEGLCVAEDSLITLANGEKKQIKDIKPGEEVLSLNEETGKLVPNKVKTLLDMGYKPIYELTTSSGKSINTTAAHPYLVKIDNKEKCEEYSNNTWNKNHPKNYDQETYCLRWVSVKDLKEGMEIAVPKNQESPTKALTSAVDNILTLDCDLCLFSSDHNEISLDNERAKYGASLICSGNIFNASERKGEYSDLGASLMYLNSKLMKNSSSGFDSPENCSSISLRLPISSDKNSGEYNLYPLEDRSLIRSSINPFLINAWNTMLASITKDSISNNQEASECLFAIPDFTSSANLNACAFVNLLLDKISLARENSKSSINSFTTVSRAISNLSFNSEGISTFKTTSDIILHGQVDYLNLLGEKNRIGEDYAEWLKVKDLKEGMEIAVQDEENSYGSPFNNASANSLVVYTLTKDCSFKCGSLGQIEALSDNASAKYRASLGSGKFLIASSKNSSYSDSSENPISLSISACLISNSCLDNPDLETHNSLYLLSSDLISSGAKNSALIDENRYAEEELGFMIENKELLSSTNLILDYLYSLLFSEDMAFSNSSLLSRETSESNLLKESFLAFLPNSTLHLINSFSSADSSFLSRANLLTFSDKHSLANSLQLISGNPSILFFNSSETDKVIFGILIPPLNSVSNVETVELYKSFDDVKFERITSINILEEQHVYDLALEGFSEEGDNEVGGGKSNLTFRKSESKNLESKTFSKGFEGKASLHNFIANNILAHNTYLAGNVSLADNFTVDGSTFYVDASSNNVGIGTTAPGRRLDVLGDTNFAVQVNGSSGGGVILGAYDSNYGAIWSSANSPGTTNYSLAFNSANTVLNAPSGSISLSITDSAKMTVDSSGNVGIGTTEPTGLLHIYNTSGLANTIYDMLNLHAYSTVNIGNSFGSSINFIVQDGGEGGPANTISQMQGTRDGADNSGDLLFITANAGTLNTNMVITSGGNVGIGTTDPSNPLTVTSSSNNDLAVFNRTGGEAGGILIEGSSQLWTQQVRGNGDMLFYDNVNALSAMVIENGTGNVGIGTTTPSTTLNLVHASNYPILNVSGGNSAGAAINIENTDVLGEADIDMRFAANRFGRTNFILNNGTVRASVDYHDGERAMRFFIGDTSAPDVVIVDSGRVGIGDETPDYGLDVVADINSDDCFREAGTQVAGTCASDIRLKQNIQPLTGSLNKILQLKPVEFEWKPGIEQLGETIRYVEGKQVGLIAQDVQKVLPDLVKEKGGYLSIEYNLEMQMMLINAIQEQQSQIDKLKMEIKELKNRK